MSLSREQMERSICSYFDGCNEADAEKIMRTMTADAVHYFPEGGPFGALRGARAIADCWVTCVKQLGSCWTVDHLIIDPKAGEAVIEWTHFKPKAGQILRGDEWYRFNDEGRITEIKAYYACPTHEGIDVHQIGGYHYAEKGYAVEPPPEVIAARLQLGR